MTGGINSWLQEELLIDVIYKWQYMARKQGSISCLLHLLVSWLQNEQSQ